MQWELVNLLAVFRVVEDVPNDSVTETVDAVNLEVKEVVDARKDLLADLVHFIVVQISVASVTVTLGRDGVSGKGGSANKGQEADEKDCLHVGLFKLTVLLNVHTGEVLYGI